MPSLKEMRLRAAAKHTAADKKRAAGKTGPEARATGREAARGEKDRQQQLGIEGMKATSLTGSQEKPKKLPSGRKAAKEAGLPSLREAKKGIAKKKRKEAKPQRVPPKKTTQPSGGSRERIEQKRRE